MNAVGPSLESLIQYLSSLEELVFLIGLKNFLGIKYFLVNIGLSKVSCMKRWKYTRWPVPILVT